MEMVFVRENAQSKIRIMTCGVPLAIRKPPFPQFGTPTLARENLNISQFRQISADVSGGV